MKDYGLRLYPPLPTISGFSSDPSIRPTSTLTDLASKITGEFDRSVAIEGDWEGHFTIQSEDVGRLRNYFSTWLGCHVEEKTGGEKSWEGLIYKMDFIYRGERETVAIFGVPEHEQLWNAVQARYVAPSLTESPELMTNPGFEQVGTGSPDLFEGWAESAGTGTITRNTIIFHNGAASCQITFGSGGVNYVAQYLPLKEGETYNLSWYTRGDGSVAGRYLIFDNTNLANIVSLTSTGVTGTSFTEVSVDFTVPADCKEVVLFVYGPSSSGTCYHDSFSLKQYIDTLLSTGWYTSSKSIGRYGRKEQRLDVGDTNLTNAQKEAQRYLAERAWPTPITVSSSPVGQNDPTATLEVYVGGYIATAMYRFVSSTNRSVNPAFEDTITAVIQNDCEFISETKIGVDIANSLSQDAIPDGRALEVIRTLVSKGDSDDNYTYFAVGRDRRATYGNFDLNPRYFRRNGVYYTTIGTNSSANPRKVRAGVVRRMDYFGGRPSAYNGMLLDSRDMLVTIFQVDGRGNLIAANVSSLEESSHNRWFDEDNSRFSRNQTPDPIGHDGGQGSNGHHDFANAAGIGTNASRAPNGLTRLDFATPEEWLRWLLRNGFIRYDGEQERVL